MNLEKGIASVIETRLTDGTIETIIEEQFKKSVETAISKLFGSYGDVSELIREKIKSVMIPRLEGYDYSNYIVKHDSVLVDILNNTALDHKNILENFKILMTPIDTANVTISDVYDEWTKYVAAEVETDGLEVNTDDADLAYEAVETTYEYNENESYSWRKDRVGEVVFECSHDPKMNIALVARHWDWMGENQFYLEIDRDISITSLKNLDSFRIYLMKLRADLVKVKIDKHLSEEWVYPTETPSVDFY